jgi:hypothetical protein
MPAGRFQPRLKGKGDGVARCVRAGGGGTEVGAMSGDQQVRTIASNATAQLADLVLFGSIVVVLTAALLEPIGIAKFVAAPAAIAFFVRFLLGLDVLVRSSEDRRSEPRLGAPAGWYEAPDGGLRWYDGEGWTDRRRSWLTDRAPLLLATAAVCAVVIVGAALA